MPIFHQNKTIFIHIPKTGGTSITKKFNGEIENFKHNDFLYYKKILKNDFEKYKIFSIVRNPFERILSYFIWHLHFSNLIRFRTGYYEDLSIQEMFREYLNLTLIQNIKGFYGREYLTRKTQTEFLLDEDNNIYSKIELVEFNDINKKFKNLPHENKKLLNLNISEVYNSKTIDMVQNHFIDDFLNFRYNPNEI
jgi:hypothetical protein